MFKENLSELIDLDELSEEKFNLEESVIKANAILNIIREEDPIFNGEFEDDIWCFENHLHKTNIIFNFMEMKNTHRFRDYWNSTSVILIKCWVVELLESYYPAVVNRKLAVLLKVIEQTEFFNPNKSNLFVESLRNFSPAVQNCLENMDKQDKTREELLYELKKERSGLSPVIEMIKVTLSFLTFSELKSFEIYHKPLMSIRKGIPNEAFARQLPSGKDVLKFDYCINKYFKFGIRNPSNLLFAPILLWWKITNIIPMRISEFCLIERLCITAKYGSYYIALPRKKQPAAKRKVQVIDTLEITKDIFDLIEEYIELTNQYGETETLISYRAYLALRERKHMPLPSGNINYYVRYNFHNLLMHFYKEVVYGKFEITVIREVRPNDTRHFAFCSLLMQGISPIEIARLGGHSTIEAQYHYSNHTEYFIDIEVKKLIDGFFRQDGKLSGAFEGHEISFEDIERNSFRLPSNNTRLPMEIGYCTDELQRCESEECMLCRHWWIHPLELVDSKSEIEGKITKRKQKIIEMGNFLKNINENFKATMVSDVDPGVFTALETKAASVQEHLVEIARLTMLIGGDFD
ncbi:site-specific integrase [Sporosarcina limicola]|uniref:Integrase n=1 Tax=Sporosarcina limicola TaxID=34101 RepID=A0A927MLM1_9BACL|nr:site-specific integrase [Sporosarcina limicola]MBE1556868.1 hypothetical protein [Sporosarcina limicola]